MVVDYCPVSRCQLLCILLFFVMCFSYMTWLVLFFFHDRQAVNVSVAFSHFRYRLINLASSKSMNHFWVWIKDWIFARHLSVKMYWSLRLISVHLITNAYLSLHHQSSVHQRYPRDQKENSYFRVLVRNPSSLILCKF